MQKYCEACYPQKIKSHFLHKWSEFFLAPLWRSRKKKLSCFWVLSSRVPYWLVPLNFLAWFFETIGFIKFSPEIQREKYNNRSLAVWDAAKKIGIRVEAMKTFGKPVSQMRAKVGNRIFYYFSVPLTKICTSIDDKGVFTDFLESNGFPVPKGKIFWRKSPGIEYGKKIGFPLVVKPVRGSRSAHAVYPVRDEEELKIAIKIAKQYEPRFYVQKYVPGFLHRFTVVKDKYVFCAKRLPPHVAGDGKNTIEQLIEEKNKDSRRGERDAKNCTLHKIPLDGVTQTYLKNLGLDLDYVPVEGEYVQLAPKISIGSGGDVHERTEFLHPDNIELFKNIGAKLKVDIVGMDVMCLDAAISWKGQEFAIIEGNGLPFLDFHHYPGEGKPQDAAGVLWREILPVLGVQPVLGAQKSELQAVPESGAFPSEKVAVALGDKKLD